MFADIFSCQDLGWGATGNECKDRDTAKHPVIRRSPLTAKNHPAPNDNGAKAEKPCTDAYTR